MRREIEANFYSDQTKKKIFVEKFRLETAADGWRFVRMFQSPKRRGTRAAVALVLVAAI